MNLEEKEKIIKSVEDPILGRAHWKVEKELV